jgi:hypothetical protein
MLAGSRVAGLLISAWIALHTPASGEKYSRTSSNAACFT